MLEKLSGNRFNQILTSNYQKLKVFVFSILQNDEEAKDVVQDVFCHLWSDLDEIEDKNITSYLYTSARWKCLNVLRKRKVIHAHESFTRKQSANTELGTILTEDLDVDFMDTEIMQIVKETMEKLPEKTRDVFYMNKFNNFTYKEIAQRQNCSVKNVEYRMMVALRALSAALKDYLVVPLGFFFSLMFL